MKQKRRASLFLILLLLLGFQLRGQYMHPFQNPDLAAEERIDNLLSLMTLDEKVACLSTNPDIPRLGVRGTPHAEGLHGLAQGGPSDWGQHKARPTTIFPQAIGLAQSWDKDLLKRIATAEATEARFLFQSHFQRSGLVIRAPNADLGRDVRWGRNEECYGEDAWFNTRMVVQFVKGLQGDDPNYWLTAALMKHFLANSNEDGRDSSSSNFNERLFYEYYSYPFFKGITEGGSKAFMTAYNAWNGTPMTVHPVLKDVAVTKWQQDGIICTDGGAFQMLISSHQTHADLYQAAAACIKAGINQFLDDFPLGVYGALANNYISEGDIDTVLRGVFRVMIKLGQLDPPDRVAYQSIGINDKTEPWNTDAHQHLALEASRKSIVLLKNEKQTLPLNANKIKSIAVIGYLADTVILDWYSGTPPYRITPLQGIRNMLSTKVSIAYANGNNRVEALQLAKKSDVVIFVAGNNPTCGAGWKDCPDDAEGKEAVDRKSLQLKAETLLKDVFNVNKNTVLVLQSSFPYTINWSVENIPAILQLTHSSQETGSALADVLFGNYNPGGRLVQTWPLSINDLPDIMDYDITNGRTYMYSKKAALFPFGHGLSFTQFDYSKLVISDFSSTDDSLFVSLDLKNIGSFDGEEVVQLYVSFPESKEERPIKMLRAFERVLLKKDEQRRITLSVSLDDIAFWDLESHTFVREKGLIQMQIGASSADIRLTSTVKL